MLMPATAIRVTVLLFPAAIFPNPYNPQRKHDHIDESREKIFVRKVRPCRQIDDNKEKQNDPREVCKVDRRQGDENKPTGGFIKGGRC